MIPDVQLKIKNIKFHDIINVHNMSRASLRTMTSTLYLSKSRGFLGDSAIGKSALKA